MASRLDRPLIVIAAFGASLAIGLIVVMSLLGGLRSPNAPSAVGGPFALTDQTGKPVTHRDIVGKPTLIFFGFTHCPDICPTTLFEMSEVLRVLGKDANRLNTFFVSVDPERDTPEVMKTYISSFDPNLRGLSGSAEATAQVISSYRVYAKKVPLKDGDYTMDHTSAVYLMDKDGQFVALFDMKRTPEEAAAAIRRYF